MEIGVGRIVLAGRPPIAPACGGWGVETEAIG